MLTLKGKNVRKNWGKEREGTILDVKEVPETCFNVANVGTIVTPAHNEFLIAFPSGTMWCTKNELRLIS